MDNENILNVINRSFWTYFNSEKISTIVYDVEIPETLYKELLPHSFDNRKINENEVACIEYRKSMLSSDQDQFLISKFERTNFTLHQQKEIQINDELKKQIRNVCDVYEKKQSYTDAILEKFEAAGIEVITDKDEFDRIFETEDILQKMTNDEIIKNMIKQRDDAIEEKNRINAKKLGNFKTEVENSNKSKSENQIVIISKNQKNILSDSLKETAEKFVSVVYSRENYKKIFGDGVIESPIETIKLGSNQFVKISPGNRNNFMYAIRQTLENPSIILGKETWDNNSETFKPVHLYGKSFINDNNSEKLVESLIIFKEGNNIAVSLHPNGIDKFVEQIKTTNDIVYLDDEVSRVAAFAITDGDSHVVKENENFLSRVRQVSYSSLGQESYPLININYNRDSLLSSEEFISSKGIETGKLEITKDNFDRYFNILNQHDAFKDKRNRIASELYNFHVSSENKDEMKKWLEEQGYTITEKEVTQYMKNDNGLTYGFVHEGKIYLNPEIMNSNAAVHEYTHLWDAYTQKTNPELWNKGLELFKESNYWNEVISDQNYQNIKDNENLVLSEIHSRISGKFAEQVFNRIAELDGEQVKLDAIDWNKETWLYIQNNFFDIENNEQEIIAEFLSTPIKDLVNEKNINLNIENAQTNTNDLFKDFQFDFSKPVTWHYVDNTSLIYADTFISNEQALSLFNAAGAKDSYNEDMQYCIQYRCTSTDKNNLVYLCKFDPNVEITTPLKEIKLPENIINKVMNGVETGIKEHLQQQHTIPDYLLDAVGMNISTPDLRTYHTLKKEDVENLSIISDEEFSDIVDSIILNDYKNIPNVIRLPNIKEELAEKLGLEKDSAFVLKKSATHIRPDRKEGYNQALSTEEYYQIPKVIRETNFVLVDKRTKNFQILFDDKDEILKINKIVFNKDELGNYLVTVGKVDRRDGISETENIVIGVGVAPTISALRFPEGLPATHLRPSPITTNEILSQNEIKSTSIISIPEKNEVQEEVSDYSTDSNKPEGIMYLSENHNVFYAEPDLPREEYLKLSAQTDIDELKKQQSFLYTDENDDFGYQSNILEQREEFQHKIDRLQAKIDSLNGVPNPLNEIISSQLPASMTSLHSFTEEERMSQFIGMKNDFKNYATEEEIKLLDDKFKTLFVEPESSVEIKKGEEFHLLADEFESYFQDTKNKHYNVASNQYETYANIAFESDKRSVEQEPVPDFSMVTQNGLQKFTGYYIQAYSDKNDIYTLSNGSNTIELPGETIKELNKPNLNEINFHGEVYSHILDHQYNDFFKYREPNIAAYFEHNLAVMIRTQAQNPLDTFKAAKEIIKAMPKDEQKRTKELVKKIAASQNKSVNDLMLDMYNKAMIERPMNEDFINVNNPRNIIPRHMTDLVYTPGHKIDDNSELRIGENINKVPVKAFKLNGKKQTIYLNLEVVSASKDKNLIVMKDSKENIYELPRDKILSQYEKNSIYNRRNQSVSVKHYNDSSMER